MQGMLDETEGVAGSGSSLIEEEARMETGLLSLEKTCMYSFFYEKLRSRAAS